MSRTPSRVIILTNSLPARWCFFVDDDNNSPLRELKSNKSSFYQKLISKILLYANLVLPSISQMHSSLLVRDADLKSERFILSLFLGFADLLDISKEKLSAHENAIEKIVYWVNKQALRCSEICELHENVFFPLGYNKQLAFKIPHNKFFINSAVCKSFFCWGWAMNESGNDS